jgi:hypothetical protein
MTDIQDNVAELRPKDGRLQSANPDRRPDRTNAERQRRFKERRKQRQLATVTEPPQTAVTEEPLPVVTDLGNAGVAVPMDSDSRHVARLLTLAEPATPRIEVRPPRYRTWSAIGRASVGLAIVVTGAWIAYTSMRGNVWFGHSLTPDQAAGDIYSQLSVAAEVLACLIPTAIRFYAQDGERWTALRGWALMLVTLAVVFPAAGGFAITNLNSGIEARAERQTSEVVLAQRKLDTLTKAREAECKRRGPECRRLEREEQDAIADLGRAQAGVKAEADPQAAALGVSPPTLHLVQAGAMVALCLFSGLFISFGAGLIWPRS